jgi:SIR2-like protein
MGQTHPDDSTFPSPPFEEGELHIRELAATISQGLLSLFLGAGVNLASIEPHNESSGSDRVPDGRNLAATLAREFSYPFRGPCLSPDQILAPSGNCSVQLRCWPNEELSLTQVAQVASSRFGTGRILGRVTQELSRVRQQPTIVHNLVAFIAQKEAKANLTEATKFPLIITTNYDDITERALRCPYDLIYLGTLPGSETPGFWFKIHGDDPRPYSRPKDPKRDNWKCCTERPAVLKIHGTLASECLPGSGVLVLSEDDYIDFSRNDLRLPISVEKKLKNSSLLFLGYSLKDWNLRVFLRRLERLSGNKFEAKSWALMPNVSPVEREAWLSSAKVDAIAQIFDKFVPALTRELQRS